MWQPASVRGRETTDELETRGRQALEECIGISKGITCQSLALSRQHTWWRTWVTLLDTSITSHSKIIQSMLKELGSHNVRMELGEMRMVVVKARCFGKGGS